MILRIKRVPYGKASTPIHDREYRMLSGGPVGTRSDWEVYAKTHGYKDVEVVGEKRKERPEYSFTWSTRSFYKRENGKVTRMKQAPKPKEFATRVMKAAPNWIEA